jgi:glycosyltransferase involved in cell wall biosynthesis
VQPLISCVVPTHNGQAFLAGTLRSLLAQTWRHLEIIVVDDSSTDRSFEIAAAFGPTVKIVRINECNPVLARNHGISLANGAYVAFLDHDDISPPERLSAQHAAFVADQALDVCIGMVQRFSQLSSGAPMTKIGEAVPGYLTISMLAQRAVFQTVGPLNPAQRYADSAEWFLRAQNSGCRIRLLPDIVTYHRIHGQNLSLTRNDDARREFVHLLRSKIVSERLRQ